VYIFTNKKLKSAYFAYFVCVALRHVTAHDGTHKMRQRSLGESDNFKT